VKVFYTDHFVLPLPDGHRFPMQKYSLLREAVQAYSPHSLEEAPAAQDDELLLAHDAAYVGRMSSGTLTATEIRQIGFPWSPEMAERARRSSGATIAAAIASLTQRCAINLAGGTHHAFADHGEGFCCYNDAAVAARALQRDHGVQDVLICDLDVHQGNGTAAIFRDDPTVFTLSLHGQKNFPWRKEAGDLDVELPDDCGDEVYLRALQQALDQAWQRQAERPPQLAFYLAGADPHADDRLGRLCLSSEGLAERDRRVFEFLARHRVPVAVAMAGGYNRDVHTTVAIHCRTLALAVSHQRRWAGGR